MHETPTKTRLGTPIALLRGLLALTAIVLVVVGIPYALIQVGGNPLPSSLSWSDITSALTSPDDGTLFLGALLWIAWIGWASFILGFVLEIPAAIRGRKARRFKGLGVQQRAAATLITAVVGMFVVGPIGVATAAENPQPAPPTTVTASETTQNVDEQKAPTAAATQTKQTAAATTAPAKQPQHVVKPGESLWRIAEKELGDGARWPEIAELNYGRPQPGGQALDNTHWVDPGWTLVLPAKPAAEAAVQPAVDEKGATHVVRKGDTLWGIAEDKLGDGTRYPEIFKASAATVQPGGEKLTDPDLIKPGWTLTIPGVTPSSSEVATPEKQAPAKPAQPPAEPPVEQQQEPPVENEEPAGESEQAPAQEQPSAEEQPAEEAPPVENEEPQAGQEPAEPQEEATEPEPAAEVPAVTDDAPSDETATDADEGFPIRTVAGVGSLLAAGILAYLAAKRRGQQRRRKPGERIAMPTEAASATENELRTVADPMSVDTVDIALRGLALSCSQNDIPLPPVRLARLTSGQFELYLTEPTELPEPFVATDEPHVWVLPSSAAAELDQRDLASVTAPYPSLVTIGHGPEDGHILVDLERLGTLALSGDTNQSVDVIAALAVELATSPWADDLQVTLVGVGKELAAGLDTGRVRYLSSVGNLLDDLVTRADHDREALANSGAATVDDARTKGVAAATWTPEIILLGTTLTDEQQDKLTELVEALPRVAVAAVTNGAPIVSEWTLELNSTDPEAAMLLPLEVEVNPQRLDQEQYRQVLDLLGITEETGTQVWEQTSVEPDIADLPVRETPHEEEVTSSRIPTQSSPLEKAQEHETLASALAADTAENAAPDTQAEQEQTPVAETSQSASIADLITDALSKVGPSERAQEEPQAQEEVPETEANIAPEPAADEVVAVPSEPEPTASEIASESETDEVEEETTVAEPVASSDEPEKVSSQRATEAEPEEKTAVTAASGDEVADLVTAALANQESVASNEPEVIQSLEEEFEKIREEETQPARPPLTVVPPLSDETATGPTVLLLGPVDVDGATGPIEQSKYRQLTEIAAYIALHPGLDHSALDEAIWPGNRVAHNTRNTAISKLRRWFGTDEVGEDYLPRVDSGYQFHEKVSTDWDQWQAIVGDDPQSVTTDHLASALELVRGQPFTGTNPRRYVWAEPLKQDMISAIVDAAHELAQRALKAGDARLARKAATIGLQAEPGMEILWRDRIKAEHIAGNRAGVADAINRLTAITDDLGDDLEEATVHLLDQVMPSRSPRRKVPRVELSDRLSA